VRVLDLFAGIGGFTIGLERAGFETVAFCEIEPYAQKVLRKNWPGVPIYDDVRTITAERLASDGIGVDVITGGFPCQDISVAGNQAGIQDGTRSGLWSECARLLGELRPRYAIFENVTNLLNGERGAWFKRVLWDISAVGYDAEWHCIPASALGAHHHRDRVWIIAYPNSGKQSVGVDGSELKGSSEITSARQEPSGRRSSEQDMADTNDNGSSSTEESRGATPRGDNSEAGQEQASESEGLRATRINEDVADTIYPRLQRGIHWRQDQRWKSQLGHPRCGGSAYGQPTENQWDTEPDVGRVANGVPLRAHRLKCLGNAVVPPIPELIGRAIREA
jgi:DNA (cytosine-5)-methyltransferase 1